jgi:hypothetical protein
MSRQANFQKAGRVKYLTSPQRKELLKPQQRKTSHRQRVRVMKRIRSHYNTPNKQMIYNVCAGKSTGRNNNKKRKMINSIFNQVPPKCK